MIIALGLLSPAIEDDARSLARWLADDPDTRRLQRPSQSTQPTPGAMGVGLDVLQFAVSSGLDVSALVFTYLQWRQARGSRFSAVVHAGGRRVELEGDDAEQLITQVQKLLDEGQDDAAE
jgi:hypothetical protein